MIIENMRSIHDSTPYLRGAIAAMGYNQIGVPHKRNERINGDSKFSFRDLVSLAMDGIVNHSTIPLKLATYIGLITFLLGLLAMISLFVG